MKIKLKTYKVTPEQFASRAFKLVYHACDKPGGMGVFQARDQVTEEQIFNNVKTDGDYPDSIRDRDDGRYYGDYVFGRMMKWGMSIRDGVLDLRDAPYRPDYQSFCDRYPTPESIVESVLTDFNLPSDAYEIIE